LLTGRSFDDQLADPAARPIVAERDNGERLVMRPGARLADALVASDQAHLHSLATPWSTIEELHGEFTPDELAEFTDQLRALATRATDTNGAVYCWICV
jgi:hypothetical protein